MARHERSHRVAARSTRAWIRGRETDVVDLSIGGACLAVTEALATQPFPLALRHPHVAETAHVRADVVWVRARDGGCRAGIRFLDLAGEERLLLRRCMLAEHGHGVWTSREAARPVGYVVPTGTAQWGIFDPQVRRVASVRKADGRLALSLGAEAPQPTPSLAEAAARALELPRRPWLDPPILDEGRAPARLTGSAVLDAGRQVGFVARTGESWSFFDARRDPLGFMTVKPGGEWRVVVLGSNDDGALDLRAASSYPDALAAAFSLAGPPELRSTTFEPTSLLEP